MVQHRIILSKMVKYGQNFDYKVIPMGPAYNQVSWSSSYHDLLFEQNFSSLALMVWELEVTRDT